MAEKEPVSILVVDDRPTQRRALAAVLSDLGVQLREAASGRDALRLVLQYDFAVILLDVNMPGMDGFETASLIRQRKQSEHTPIIFVTAYGDETHAARGYLLGAVDYIQAPVDPQVLRTKVSVFVDLFRRTEEATRYAASLREHATRLRHLAELSLAVHEAGSVVELLGMIASAAASIVGAEQVSAEVHLDPPPPFARPAPGSLVRHVVLKPEASALSLLPADALCDDAPRVLRVADAALKAHPEWGPLTRPQDGLMPLRGLLGVPLVSRDGLAAGAIHLSGKRSGEFQPEDEAILVQVAQIASLAIENTLFKEAQEANRLKDQFLAMLSHELRTPLQALLSWARILQEQPAEPEILARGIEVIARNAEAQKQLIDDLLDVSRIMTNKLRLEIELVSLSNVLDVALATAQPAADAKGLVVHLRTPEQPLAVRGDSHRLQQLIGNLLSNAIRFTPKGGEIRVTLERQAGRGLLRIADTGEGIIAEFLPHIFERFRQADSSSTRSHTGLGIGLAIVRHLTELHGGNVRAESLGEGKGATFMVELPLALGEDEVARSQDRLAQQVEPATLEGIRILLVDDADDTRDVVALMLRRSGAAVTSVTSAAEALVALERERPDVIVSDIAMPGQDGLFLIREIRRRSEGSPRIPAAALSAYARPEESARALRAGFDVHLSKPVREDTLVAAVLSLAS